MIERFKAPVIALALGIVPFFLFVGSVSTVDVNQMRVSDNSFNLVGILFAAVGLWMVIGIFRKTGVSDIPKTILGGVAGAICLLQLGVSSGLAQTGSYALPPLQYSGLDGANRAIVERELESGDLEAIRNSILNRYIYMIDDARQHDDYGAVCHDGAYRIDHAAIVAPPDVLTDEDRAVAAQRLGQYSRPRPEPEQCSQILTNQRMGTLVDDIHRAYDMIEVLVEGYHKLEAQGVDPTE